MAELEERRKGQTLWRSVIAACAAVLLVQAFTLATFGFQLKEDLAILEVRFEVAENRISALYQTTAVNRKFQIDQRVRVWNDIKALRADIQDLKTGVATTNAIMAQVLRAVEK